MVTPNAGLDMQTPPGAEILLSGRRYVYFGGTGYHCLQGHPDLVSAASAAMQKYGMGTATGGARPVGPSPVQKRLEETAARYFGTDDAVCLVSGYLANTVGIRGLADRCDRLFVDETAHYSVLDAARLSEKPVVYFAHRNGADLAAQLKKELREGETPLVASDGVFPTFGEIAPVADYLEVVAPYQGLLWLDDAHAVGVLGPAGRGTYDHFGLSVGLSGENCFFCGSCTDL